jgi:hypothetical protein
VPNPQTHITRQVGGDEAHQQAGDNIKSVVFGGLDGILTSFAIVAGAAGQSRDFTTFVCIAKQQAPPFQNPF